MKTYILLEVVHKDSLEPAHIAALAAQRAYTIEGVQDCEGAVVPDQAIERAKQDAAVPSAGA